MIQDSKLQRIQGKKVRYWFQAGMPAGTSGIITVNPGGTSPLPGAVGNIVGGNVPYPMNVTSVKSQFIPDGAAITQSTQTELMKMIAYSTITVQKANQVTVFEFSTADCQRVQLAMPGAGTQTSTTIDLTSREKRLEGNKQNFVLGDVCSIIVNFGAVMPFTASIYIELNGYTV